MNKNDTLIQKAFSRLAELARRDGIANSRLFALVWLAAAKVVAQGVLPGKNTPEKLTEISTWKSLIEAGFPNTALDVVFRGRAVDGEGVNQMKLRVSAASIVADLHGQLGDLDWDVLSSLEYAEADGAIDRGPLVVPELVELLMDELGKPDEGELWIPFDSWGQFTIRAVRRGWKVQITSLMPETTLVTKLLLAIEDGQLLHSQVRDEVVRNGDGYPINRADHALVIPPTGLQVKDSQLEAWSSIWSEEKNPFNRSESWAVYEIAGRTNKRAVFLVPQGLLTLQEKYAWALRHRLSSWAPCIFEEKRDEMSELIDGASTQVIEAIYSLPMGVFKSLPIAGAVLVVNKIEKQEKVFLADLGRGRRSLAEVGNFIEEGRSAVLERRETKFSRRLWPTREEEHWNEEYLDTDSWAPSRYLQKVSPLDGVVAKLREICDAIRPPTTTKEGARHEGFEVGIQDLNKWKSISHLGQKSVLIKGDAKLSTYLQPKDVVISVKGTVGKVGLIGDIPSYKAVVSQSCLALRINTHKPEYHHLTPEYLIMYLRSPHGQAQLDSMKVGTTVQHITIGSLLDSVLVPIPTLEEVTQVQQDYERMCICEGNVFHLLNEIEQLRQGRWPV